MFVFCLLRSILGLLLDQFVLRWPWFVLCQVMQRFLYREMCMDIQVETPLYKNSFHNYLILRTIS